MGCLDDDLATAVTRALQASPAACRAYAERFSWRESARQFFGNLVPVTETAAETAARSAADEALRRTA